MAKEKGPVSEQEVRKQTWLRDLSGFIVEANKNTWAADLGEVEPQRPGFKELEYKRGQWKLRDSYAGYFKGPGMTTVYYQDVPAWAMLYAGVGQVEGHEATAKETYAFLRTALMKATPEHPFRGPELHEDGRWRYTFKLDGNIEDGLWREEITDSGILVFSQSGIIGTSIPKDENRQPILPWNRPS